MEDINREFLPYVILIAIVSVGIEFFVSKRNGLENYDKQESLISAAIFAMGTVANVVFRALIGWILLFAHQHRLLEVPLGRPMQFAVVFGLVEFSYYWMHRYSHRVRLGWASHVVHHSAECFNFSIAYRLGVTGFFSFLWAFYVPIAWLGFDPKVIALCLSLNLFYQFWLHTELIPKLGWFEWFFNTPSHHRVHHASNPLYLDRNFGGVVIIFDRLFGTFEPEHPKIKIEYGLTEKIAEKSVMKIVFMGWTSLWNEMKHQKRLKDKIALVLQPPGWAPGGGKTSDTLRRQWIGKNEL